MKTKNKYTKILPAFIVLLIIFCTNAQAQTKLQQGKNLMESFEYSKALLMFSDYLKSSAATIDDARDMTKCYYMTSNTRDAAEWQGKVIEFETHTAADILLYAKLLMAEGNYADAITQFKHYQNHLPIAADKANKWIESCQLSQEWINNPEYVLVKNVSSVNTLYSEFGLEEYNDEYIITSDRKLPGKEYSSEEITGWSGNPYYKLYSLKSSGDSLSSDISAMDELNNDYHNGPGIVSSDSKAIYFTRTKMVKVTKRPVNSDPTSWYDNSEPGDYINRLEIYYASFENGKWKTPQAFQYNDPKEYSVGHPVLSTDGGILYFVSDMPGGYGGSDIYYSEKEPDGNWSEPTNAGPVINSDGNEEFPYVSQNGTLYFSSDGWPGMGGLDIFYSTGSKNSWTDRENMKYPMNSPKDDFSIMFTSNGTGYFSSNRDGGQGSDDIYSFMPDPPKNLILVGITKEKQKDNSLISLSGVNVKLNNSTNNTSTNLVSDMNGKFISKVDCGFAYDVTGTLDGYFKASKDFSTICKTKNDTIYVELDLDKIIINKPIVIENIYYDFDKWNIRPDAAIELDKIVKVLNDNPEIKIELGSHTDSRGTNAYNEVLSQKRAESAVDYIITRGISSDRITAKGYGESQPVNTCTDGASCSEEDFQKNRRTEFKVTGYINN